MESGFAQGSRDLLPEFVVLRYLLPKVNMVGHALSLAMTAILQACAFPF